MKGTILGLELENSVVVILGGDDKRYRLSKSEWKSAGDPKVGMAVDFVVSADDLASEAYFIQATVENQGAAQSVKKENGSLKQYKKILVGFAVALVVVPLVIIMVNGIFLGGSQKASQDDENKADNFSLQGSCLVDPKNPNFNLSEGIALLTKAIELKTKYLASTYLQRGFGKSQNGDSTGAISDFKIAIKLCEEKIKANPNDADAKADLDLAKSCLANMSGH